MNSKTASQLASQLKDVIMKDHFGSDAFSANKRIFATVWHNVNRVNLRLSLEQQKEFLISDEEAFTAMNNAWGKKGWTSVHLDYISKADFLQALKTAFEYSAVKGKK